MGNRIQGFFAGAFFTGALAAAAVGTIQDELNLVSGLIRNCDQIIQKRILNKEQGQEPMLVPAKYVTEPRPCFKEICANAWNDEVIKDINLLYAINWVEVGIQTDKIVTVLLKQTYQAAKNLINSWFRQ